MLASFALFIKNCHTVNDDHAVFAVSATSAIVRKRVRPRIAQCGGALRGDTKNGCVADWHTYKDRKAW